MGGGHSSPLVGCGVGCLLPLVGACLGHLSPLVGGPVGCSLPLVGHKGQMAFVTR